MKLWSEYLDLKGRIFRWDGCTTYSVARIAFFSFYLRIENANYSRRSGLLQQLLVISKSEGTRAELTIKGCMTSTLDIPYIKIKQAGCH